MNLCATPTSAMILHVVAFAALLSPIVGQAQYGNCPDPVAACFR